MTRRAYCREGRAVLEDLRRRGVPPLVVGGTGLYLKALLGGLFAQGEPAPGVRERVRQELASLGLPVLYARLIHLDPATATRLHPHDTYRILRALEVMAATGRPLSEFIEAHRFQDVPYEVLKLGLELDREELYRRIDLRVEIMLEAGWLDEIEGLLEPLPAGLKAPAGPGLPPPDQLPHRPLELGRGLNAPGPGHPPLRQAPAHLVFLRSPHPLVSPRPDRGDGRRPGRVFRVRRYAGHIFNLSALFRSSC